MSASGIAKLLFLKRDFRKIANEIYGKFPFFFIDEKEFRERCLSLQRCGAGIVLGRPFEDVDVRVVAVNDASTNTSYENLPIGNFGEIIFKKCGEDNFTHTEYYGFFDQRGRVWCCGQIKDTVISIGKKYFPYCIEPLFEMVWWVKTAKFSASFVPGCADVDLHVKVLPKKILRPFVRIFYIFFVKKLENFSKKFKISSSIKTFDVVFDVKQLESSD